MKQYVLGFAIDNDAAAVLLISKQRPEWQKNLLNGIGGHVHGGESPAAAMVREFKEETGIDTTEEEWKPFATMQGPGWECSCFKSFEVTIYHADTITDEEVVIIDIDCLFYENVVSSLLWLVHMAGDNCHSSSDKTFDAVITYA